MDEREMTREWLNQLNKCHAFVDKVMDWFAEKFSYGYYVSFVYVVGQESHYCSCYAKFNKRIRKRNQIQEIHDMYLKEYNADELVIMSFVRIKWRPTNEERQKSKVEKG